MPEIITHRFEYMLGYSLESVEDVDKLDKAYAEFLMLSTTEAKFEAVTLATEAGSSTGHILVNSSINDKNKVKNMVTQYLDESGVKPAFVSTAFSDNV